METLKEKLLKDIKETGYPLELQISNIFEKNGWDVLHNAYYIDKDEKKGREIDLIVSDFQSQSDEKNKQYIEYSYSLIIEIKQANAKPWVFFTNSEDRRHFPHHIALNSSAEKNRLMRPFAFNNHFLNKTGKSFYEGFTKNGGRDDIFKALSGSVKAMYHFKENSFASGDKSPDLIIESFAPMIIVDGELFEAYINSKNELELVESNYVQVAFNYLSPNYISDTSQRAKNEFLVHVVRYSYLSEFLGEYRFKQNDIFQDLLKETNERLDTEYSLQK